MTFAELVKLMKNRLSTKPNPIAERFRFNTRDRQPEESVANYVMELRRLTEHCEYGMICSETVWCLESNMIVYNNVC